MPLHLSLTPHPDTPCGVTTIDVRLSRVRPKVIELIFLVLGGARHVYLPKPREFAREELWKSTCFELFVRSKGDGSYYEVNQSPRGDWMAFRFDRYRDGRVDLPAGVTSAGEWVRGKQCDWWTDYPYDQRQADAKQDCWLNMRVDLSGVHDLLVDQDWELGITAVIAENNGRKSYWSLAHPDGAPDFHHDDCFALELPKFR